MHASPRFAGMSPPTLKPCSVQFQARGEQRQREEGKAEEVVVVEQEEERVGRRHRHLGGGGARVGGGGSRTYLGLEVAAQIDDIEPDSHAADGQVSRGGRNMCISFVNAYTLGR